MVDEQQWQAYVDRLRTEPGIMVSRAEARDGKFILSGLRDPLAVDPLKLLTEAGIDPARVEAHFDPYQGLDPQFVLERLQASLNPPPGVTFAVEATASWRKGGPVTVDLARSQGRQLAAGRGARFRPVGHARYQRGSLGKLRDTIQARSIHFDSGKSLPAAGQEQVLDEIADELNELVTLSSDLHASPG